MILSWADNFAELQPNYHQGVKRCRTFNAGHHPLGQAHNLVLTSKLHDDILRNSTSQRIVHSQSLLDSLCCSFFCFVLDDPRLWKT